MTVTYIGESCKIDIVRNCARQQQALQACHELTCMFLGAMLWIQGNVEHWHVPKISRLPLQKEHRAR